MEHASAFEHLKILVGVWSVQHDHGCVSRVNYKMSCNDTVLVETWALKPGVESLTLYHMDDDELIATHYCPLGNQPRLLCKGVKNGIYRFETQSVTNLESESLDHCREFSFEIRSENTINRSETYVEKNIETTETGVFTRLP